MAVSHTHLQLGGVPAWRSHFLGSCICGFKVCFYGVQKETLEIEGCLPQSLVKPSAGLCSGVAQPLPWELHLWLQALFLQCSERDVRDRGLCSTELSETLDDVSEVELMAAI